MPKCDGLPDGPCPDRRCDNTVKVGQGDLLLCKSCNDERFRQFLASRPPCSSSSSSAAPAVSGAGKKQSKPVRGNRSASSSTVPDKPSTSDTVPDNSDSHCPDDVFESDDKPTVHLNKVIINELLAYISFYRNKGNQDSLQSIVLTHFSSSDISDAKKVLIDEFGCQLGATSVVTERRTTVARAAHEAEVEDIVAAIDILDMNNVLSHYHFVALNLDLLPKYGPEDTNTGSVDLRQVQMADHVVKIASDISQLKQSMDTFHHSVNDQLNKLHAAGSSAVRQTGSAAAVNDATRRSVTTIADRSMNLVVFGIEEDRNAEVWRNKVDDALSFVTGRHVDVMDMYRIGRFANDKIRPIIVKLRTVWDRRVVLSSCAKLRNYSSRVFISPDEPPDVRRKRVFERIKAKAERDGKVVSVVNDVLYVDGVGSYSLKDGAIHNDRS